MVIRPGSRPVGRSFSDASYVRDLYGSERSVESALWRVWGKWGLLVLGAVSAGLVMGALSALVL